MSYVKLFINVSKKKGGKENKPIDITLEKRIREIFKEPLEDLFDKPELVIHYFNEFLNYSEEHYNNLINTGKKVDSEYISEIINWVIETDKNNEIEYHKRIFLLEFLGNKIEEENKCQ